MAEIGAKSKEKQLGYFPVENSMKWMLDLLHPKPSGLHLFCPPWQSCHGGHLVHRSQIFLAFSLQTRSFFFFFLLTPTAQHFSGNLPKVLEAWDLQVFKKGKEIHVIILILIYWPFKCSFSHRDFSGRTNDHLTRSSLALTHTSTWSFHQVFNRRG